MDTPDATPPEEQRWSTTIIVGVIIIFGLQIFGRRIESPWFEALAVLLVLATLTALFIEMSRIRRFRKNASR